MMGYGFRLVVILLSFCIIGLQYRLWIGEGSRGHIHFLETRLQKEEKSECREKIAERCLAGGNSRSKGSYSSNRGHCSIRPRHDSRWRNLVYSSGELRFWSEQTIQPKGSACSRSMLEKDEDLVIGKEFKGVLAWI